jgi:ABC-2 type transport system permease protein
MKIPASIRLTYRNIMVNMDAGTMMFMLGLPALYLLVLGTMFQSLIPGVPVNNHSISYTHFLGPGIVAMQTLTAGNIGGSMLWSDRRWGMFEQLLVGPFKRTDYLLGIVFVAIIFTLGGSFIMFILSELASGGFILNLVSVSLTIISLVLGTILFSSLFLIISSLAKTMQAYNTITIVLFFVLDFASSAFYPINSSSESVVRYMSLGNPLTYVTDIVRTALISTPTIWTLEEIGIVIVITAILFTIARQLYKSIKMGI